MGIREEIKSIIILSKSSMSEVVLQLNEHYGYKYSLPNLSKKLSKQTIRYKDVKDIASILGYEIKWVKKETDE